MVVELVALGRHEAGEVAGSGSADRVGRAAAIRSSTTSSNAWIPGDRGAACNQSIAAKAPAA
jgi:hypothetical protein